MFCSPPGSSVHGTLQARILQWVAMSLSRGSSWPRDQNGISCFSWLAVPPGKLCSWSMWILSHYALGAQGFPGALPAVYKATVRKREWSPGIMLLLWLKECPLTTVQNKKLYSVFSNKEKESEKNIYVCVCVCIYICIYAYNWITFLWFTPRISLVLPGAARVPHIGWWLSLFSPAPWII